MRWSGEDPLDAEALGLREVSELDMKINSSKSSSTDVELRQMVTSADSIYMNAPCMWFRMNLCPLVYICRDIDVLASNLFYAALRGRLLLRQ